ncbi:MAG: hypothetical protein PHY31_07465 [Smithellaceae bacterium]|nr:hypothetical protein [Smithellaceae bacterium]
MTAQRVLIFLMVILGAVLISRPVQAVGISATGSWSETINANDLTGGAGSILNSTYESGSSQINIDITGLLALLGWRVDVSKTDGNWNSGMHLYVRRTANGSGLGSISGGTSYQELTGASSTFFNGLGNRSGIKLQFKLDGITMQLPPATYTTTVYYTVIGL